MATVSQLTGSTVPSQLMTDCLIKVKDLLRLLVCLDGVHSFGPRLHLYYRQTVADLLILDYIKDQRTGLPLKIAAGPRQRSHSRIGFPWNPGFCSLRFETPTTWRVRTPYLHLQGTGWPIYTTRQWDPFRGLLRLLRADIWLAEMWVRRHSWVCNTRISSTICRGRSVSCCYCCN
jgi:hypothetical protein